MLHLSIYKYFPEEETALVERIPIGLFVRPITWTISERFTVWIWYREASAEWFDKPPPRQLSSYGESPGASCFCPTPFLSDFTIIRTL